MNKNIVKIFFISLLFGIFSATSYFLFSQSGPYGVSENEREVEINIPAGTGIVGIGDILVTQKVLRHPYGFYIQVLLLKEGRSLKAGEYSIPSHLSIRSLIKRMYKGEVIQRFITVPEGTTVSVIIAKLTKNELLSGTISRIPTEGSILPSTYAFHRGEQRQSIVDRMETVMEKTLINLWMTRSSTCPLKTKEEVLILASIIEKESSQYREEQPRIAGVFLNRINQGMKLQSDPTVIYGITLGKVPLGRSLTRKDLEHISNYNTYIHNGLPPSPIACPGKSAIEAALNPSISEEIYFVADGTGGHAFSKTLVEHNKNVQKWRLIKNYKEQKGDDQ